MFCTNLKIFVKYLTKKLDKSTKMSKDLII